MDGRPSRTGPDPARIANLEDLARELGLLRSRAARGTRSAKVGLDDLVDRVGEPRSTVHAYLTGRRLAPSQVLDRIVIALGATPAEQREWAEAWDRVSAYRDAHRVSHAAPPVREAVLHQLPQSVDNFTGRAEQLAELDLLLSRRQTGVIAAVCGTAGAGKTALAVHWAQTRHQQFPDGQLYLDLRGFDPDQPVPPAQALARFLRALGVPVVNIPRELAECAAQYRSLLSGRRMLIMLDNARDAEQVRPLLPGAASCSVLVTSRDSLTGLIARHGGYRIDVPPLSSGEATALLRALVNPPVATSPTALNALADQCAGLPLALRIAAELAVSRGSRPLDELVDEFTTGRRRLDLLDAGDDPRTAIRAVFSWSYQLLPADAALAFRCLGLHPGPDLTPLTLAALTDSSVSETRRVLAALVRAHLVEQPAPDRYR
ncbi:MAG: NB-ARC domain-containing protein, partial [Jatrophihabitantaceae bacterium]